jgi:signal transduction histidine kinase
MRAIEKEQALVLQADESLPPTIGNPVRLRQMLSNLINNAIKYTPTRGKIQVLGHAEGGQIIIQVSDNGPGIPPSDQPYIFDKFYRGSNIDGDVTGTGLGLAIVKSIVENHEGRIWVDSTLGEGSTFTVVLPIVENEL